MSGKEKLAALAPTKQKSAVKKTPRYIELADELRVAILRGDYADPGNFPTESVLCDRYDVSRFTVREALRKLTSEGLITRKRGSGTVVQAATARAGALHQPLSNVSEILQYARDTTIAFEKRDTAAIPSHVADQIGTKPRGDWFAFRGRRMTPGNKRPIAVTEAWVHPELAEAVAQIDINAMTLFGQIETLGKVTVTRVTQDIQAIKGSKDILAELGLTQGDPVLRILRCYYDEKDRMFEISANYHPGEHFAYSMHIEVD